MYTTVPSAVPVINNCPTAGSTSVLETSNISSIFSWIGTSVPLNTLSFMVGLDTPPKGWLGALE